MQRGTIPEAVSAATLEAGVQGLGALKTRNTRSAARVQDASPEKGVQAPEPKPTVKTNTKSAKHWLISETGRLKPLNKQEIM